MSGGPAQSSGASEASEAPLLEVIALTPEDAVAAERGGADRLELVSRIDTGGLTPTLEQFQAIRRAVELPLRVMLRTNAGFRVAAEEVERLLRQVDDLRAAGADQFVFGFLDAAGDLDVDLLATLCSATHPYPWTLQHAFDHTSDPEPAWAVARNLPSLDAVLSGGVRGDLGQGLQTLCDRAGWQTDRVCWLAGGGLVLEYVAPLTEAGIRWFHIGRAARAGHSWERPVSGGAVRRWRELLDEAS